MFEIDSSRSKPSLIELSAIVDEYEVIHFDETPILFTGKNVYGLRFLGSLVEEDFDNNVQYSFHVPITQDTYSIYLRREKSYRQIITNSDNIFVVQSSLSNEILEVFLVRSSDIPPDYLPAADSYCGAGLNSPSVFR